MCVGTNIASDIDKCSLSVARSKSKNNQDTIFFRFKYKAKLTLKYKWDEYTRDRNPLVIYIIRILYSFYVETAVVGVEY